MRLSREQPLGDGDLLLVAAGERADPGPQRAVVDLDAVEDAADRLGLAAAVDQPGAAEALDHRQRDVVLAGELDEQRLGLAVLRQEAERDVGAKRIERAS